MNELMINYFVGLGTGLVVGFAWGVIIFYRKKEAKEEEVKK